MNQAFENDYFDYIYNIVTIGIKWYFIIYTLNDIYFISSSEYQINLIKSTIKKNSKLLQSIILI